MPRRLRYRRTTYLEGFVEVLLVGGGGLSIGGDHGKSRRPGDESGGDEGGGRAGKEGESGKVLHGGSVGINGFGSSGKRRSRSTCVFTTSSFSSGFLRSYRLAVIGALFAQRKIFAKKCTR